MKCSSFHYSRPEDIDAALALLADDADARVIAGGQSLVPTMNFRMANPTTLVDLGGIAELRGIRVDDDGAVIAGSMTRHSDFEFSDIIAERLPLLSAAMPGVAHMPIRNRGTIGGSLAHADPAGDWPALCVVCDAELLLRGVGGERIVRAEEFGLGIFSTALEEGELIRAIRFPAWPQGRRWGLQKMTRRRGDFALVGALCLLDFAGDNLVEAARIVIYGATESPLVLHESSALVGHPASVEAVASVAAAAAATDASVLSDMHASEAYRRELIGVLVRRAIEQALSEARHSYD